MARVDKLTVGDVTLDLPVHFPSVSSVKTNFPPSEYVRLLVELEHPQFLLSAYDVFGAPDPELATLLARAVSNGQVVLADSGNYESFWKDDVAWTVDRFLATLERLPCHIRFTYDNQSPPDTAKAIADEVIQHSKRDAAAGASGYVVPIVHGRGESLPQACRLVTEHLSCKVVAVAERELGCGILERTRTLHAIRTQLDSLDMETAIHVLGTGNPVSIAAYFIAGADSFDGLEWCQTVVDHESGRLSHFQHGDLFLYQTPVAGRSDPDFAAAVLAHNLVYYERLMDNLRTNGRGAAKEILERSLGTSASPPLVNLLGDLVS